LAPERDGELLLRAAADDRDLHRGPGAIAEHRAETIGSRDGNTVDLDDDVSDRDASRRRGAAVLDGRHQRAAIAAARCRELGWNGRGNRADAQVAAPYAPVRRELADDALERRVRHADIGPAQQRARVHADDLAVGVDERAAGEAARDLAV